MRNITVILLIVIILIGCTKEVIDPSGNNIVSADKPINLIDSFSFADSVIVTVSDSANNILFKMKRTQWNAVNYLTDDRLYLSTEKLVNKQNSDVVNAETHFRFYADTAAPGKFAILFNTDYNGSKGKEKIGNVSTETDLSYVLNSDSTRILSFTATAIGGGAVGKPNYIDQFLGNPSKMDLVAYY